MLEDLADQLVRSLSLQLQALEALPEARDPEFALRLGAARSSWARSIRAQQQQVAQYLAGYVEGGGLALALLTELAPEHAGHVGHVAEVLAARVAFVPKRAEAGVTAWLREVHRSIEALLRGEPEPDEELQRARLPAAEPTPLRIQKPPAPRPEPGNAPESPVEAPSAQPSPAAATTLATLLEQARSLGVRVRNVPEAPTAQYLARLAAQLAQVEAKREAEKPPGAKPRVSLELLLGVAANLGVRLKEIPERPSDLYLEKLQAKLVEVAHRRGVPVPLGLGAPPPEPQTGLDNSPTTDVAPEADEEHRARIDSLVQRALEANLDLGRIPVDPTHEWVAATQSKLEAAIERRNAERRAEIERRDAERQAQLDRLTSLAERLGVELRPPKFPTDEWLARAELRIASQLLVPPGGEVPVDARRSERFNRIVVRAADANVDLGDLPAEPDDTWLEWAEEQVDDATGAHTIAFEAETPATPQAWLVFEEGTVQEHKWPVTADAEVTIGRGRGNTIQIRNDAGVSRRHCTVRLEDGTAVIRDEGSTKGVVVDGEQRTESWLVGGEQIVLGETLFVFRMG